MQELDVPFMLHLGGGPLFLREGFLKNGKTIEAGPLGGADEIRSKDYMVCHYGAEAFMSAMVLDGVLEKFPKLRGAVIEQGAMWVVPWLKKLDIAQAAFVRFEPYLNLPLKPSEYVHRQLKFTPFPPEPVGWMIEQAAPICSCSRPTLPIPRAAATRSNASRRRWTIAISRKTSASGFTPPTSTSC